MGEKGVTGDKGENGDKGERGEKWDYRVVTRLDEILSLNPHDEITNFPRPRVGCVTTKMVVILSEQVIDDFFIRSSDNSYCLSILLTRSGESNRFQNRYMFDILADVCRDRERLARFSRHVIAFDAVYPQISPLIVRNSL